ncbi:hypothetical protein TWF506_010047 [Arthrobotrys conoides]|uniref:Uncharacterized protein n=1 Tax=Arthrobotrys conoides TaxID=74498 RepID=A0AAN8RWL2_9PEZI
MSALSSQQTPLEDFNQKSHLEHYGISREQVSLSSLFPRTLPEDSDTDFKELVEYFDKICKPYAESRDSFSGDFRRYLAKIITLKETIASAETRATTADQKSKEEEAIEIERQNQENLANFLQTVVDRAFKFLKTEECKKNGQKESELDEKMPFFVMNSKVKMTWTSPKGTVGPCAYRATSLGGVVGLMESPVAIVSSKQKPTASRRKSITPDGWGMLVTFQASPLKTGLHGIQSQTYQPAADAGCLIGQAVKNLYKSHSRDRHRRNRNSICITIRKTSIYFSRAGILARDLRHYKQHLEPSASEKVILHSREFDFLDKEERKELLRGIMAVFRIVKRDVGRVLEEEGKGKGGDEEVEGVGKRVRV